MEYADRFRQILKKYGKVGLGVHLSVSAASIFGFYVAIKNDVDVVALLHKVGLGGAKTHPQIPKNLPEMVPDLPSASPSPPPGKTRYPIAATSSGVFFLAFICNKALFPIRVPITIILTPPIARFLARRNLYRSGMQYKCGNCRQLGHNRRTCSVPPKATPPNPKMRNSSIPIQSR